ncbi:hypothetical protein AgCh_029647 [Apium graveolens]
MLYPPDKNGSDAKVSELFKEVKYSMDTNVEKRIQFDDVGFKMKICTRPHYLYNFVQSTLNALSVDKVRGATLFVSGDGRYYSKKAIQVDIYIVGVTNFEGPEGDFHVDVFDSASDYVKLMKSIFDFQSIQKLVASPQFSFSYDALHGVSGACARLIFVDELGAQESSLLNCMPKAEHEPLEFCAATTDGDADCHMFLVSTLFHNAKFFVTPSDSVAIIVVNTVESIPYFSSGLKEVARSMPTSAALDDVAKHLNLKFFEVPTRWKFFGNLMDAGLDNIHEKDGIWIVLAWLSILAYKNKENFSKGKLVTVEDIVHQHWATIVKGISSDVSKVSNADEFKYKDLVDGSISKHLGVRYLFEDGSRLASSKIGRDSQEALAPLVDVALTLSKLQEFTG